MELLTSQSTIIGLPFILFGALILGLGIWGRKESDAILPGSYSTPENRKKLVNLFDNMDRYLSEEDINHLCFVIGINHEDLPGNSRQAKARELILASERQGKLDDLIAACKKRRPNVTSWVDNSWISPLRPTLTKPARITLGVIGTSQMLIGLGVMSFFSPQTPPPISLQGITFELGGYNPHLLDLRTDLPTLPVRENSLLQFPEIWLTVQATDPDLWVWVEIYRDDGLAQVVGYTEPVKVTSERLLLTDITIDEGADVEHPDNWRIPAGWGDFYITILGQYEGREDKIILDVERIHFDEESAAWLDNSPNVGVVSIAYSINDLPPQLLDLRNIENAGIVAQSGDTLAITEAWYHFTRTYQEQGNVSMEATLLDSNGLSLAKITTDREPLKEGVHLLNNVTELRWTVPEDTGELDFLLVDQDGAVVDKLKIAVDTELGAHLVPAETSVIWPFDAVNYIDFENVADMAGVSNNPPFTEVTRSQEKAFSGNYSLAVTTLSDETVFMEWDYPFQADVVSLQVYWPKVPGITVHWAQVCFSNGSFCWSIPIEEGRWNTSTLNLFAPANGIPENQMNDQDYGGLFIRGAIGGVDTDSPYTFYVDGIQISPAQ